MTFDPFMRLHVRALQINVKIQKPADPDPPALMLICPKFLDVRRIQMRRFLLSNVDTHCR